MAGMGLSLGYAAGAGADSLESLVKQRLLQQAEQRQQLQDLLVNQQAQQRTAIDQGQLGINQQAERRAQAEQPSIIGLREAQRTSAGATAKKTEADTEQTRVTTDTNAFKLATAKTEQERNTAALARLRQSNPTLADFFDLGGQPAAYDTQLGEKAKTQKEIAAMHDNAALVPVNTVDENNVGITSYLPRGEVAGKSFPKPPSASGGTLALQGARASSAKMMLDDLQKTHASLQTGEGPAQLVKGAIDKARGYLNLSNPATEYRKKRLATAVALAVAIQGSRPSDKDAEAMADLLPDYNTPNEVAQNLFRSTQQQLGGVAAAMGRPGTAQTPTHAPQGGTTEWDFDAQGNLVPRK